MYEALKNLPTFNFIFVSFSFFHCIDNQRNHCTAFQYAAIMQASLRIGKFNDVVAGNHMSATRTRYQACRRYMLYLCPKSCKEEWFVAHKRFGMDEAAPEYVNFEALSCMSTLSTCTEPNFAMLISWSSTHPRRHLQGQARLKCTNLWLYLQGCHGFERTWAQSRTMGDLCLVEKEASMYCRRYYYPKTWWNWWELGLGDNPRVCETEAGRRYCFSSYSFSSLLTYQTFRFRTFLLSRGPASFESRSIFERLQQHRFADCTK